MTPAKNDTHTKATRKNRTARAKDHMRKNFVQIEKIRMPPQQDDPHVKSDHVERICLTPQHGKFEQVAKTSTVREKDDARENLE